MRLKKHFNFHHHIWQHLSNRYGPIVGLRLGRDRLVIVSGKDAIRKFYNMSEFDGRPDGFFFRVRSFDQRLGLVFVDGQFQEEQRAFTMRALKQLGFGMNAMAATIESEAAEMVRYFTIKAGRGDSILMNEAFDVSMVNLIWTMVAGYRCELDDERLNSLKRYIHESFHIIDLSGGILNQFPAIRHLFPTASGFEPLVNALQPLWQFLGDAISEIDESYDRSVPPKSLIEYFLREMDVEKAGTSFTADQLLCACLDLFQAGTETTSNTLVFGLIYMLNYPRVAEKVREELEVVVGGSNLPKLGDRSQLPYTMCVINEILRLSTVAPLALVHRAVKDVSFDDYIIRKDTLALVSIHSLHMDREYWKDPQVFRPERFMDGDGKMINHEFNLLPFGHGEEERGKVVVMDRGTFLNCFILLFQVVESVSERIWPNRICLSFSPPLCTLLKWSMRVEALSRIWRAWTGLQLLQSRLKSN